MRRIGVTVEITKRLYREFDVSDEQIKELKKTALISSVIGSSSYDQLINDTCAEESSCVDYAVTDDNGVTLIDWS